MRTLTARDEAALRAIAERHGYLAERGPHAREGSSSRLVDALVAGELVTISLTPGERKKLLQWLEQAPSADIAGIIRNLTAQVRASLPPTSPETAPESPASKAPSPARRRLTSEEAAQYLHLSVSRVQELARKMIIGRKDNGQWTFSKGEIARYQQDRILESQARALQPKRTRRRSAGRSSSKPTDDDLEVLDWLVEQQREQRTPAAGERTVEVQLWLRVENNNSFVRGKKRAREDIERYVLSQYGMRKSSPDSDDYILTIPYTTDESLENTIYRDISSEAERHADSRHCFIEADVRARDGSERSW